MLSVLGPRCAAFSRRQSLNAHKREVSLVWKEWTQALMHFSFACELMQLQLCAGMCFLSERAPTGCQLVVPGERPGGDEAH